MNGSKLLLLMVATSLGADASARVGHDPSCADFPCNFLSRIGSRNLNIFGYSLLLLCRFVRAEAPKSVVPWPASVKGEQNLKLSPDSWNADLLQNSQSFGVEQWIYPITICVPDCYHIGWALKLADVGLLIERTRLLLRATLLKNLRYHALCGSV